MVRARRRLAALLCTAALASGCLPFTEPSEGELGRVEYSWDEGLLGCLFGCDAEAPLAVSGHAFVVVHDADELPPFTVSTDAPEVALFTQDGAGSNAVRAEGVSEGRARVVIRDARSGEVIDRLPIRVRQVDRIEPGRDLPGDELLLVEGTDIALRMRLFAGDREMVGVGALGYELAPALGRPAPSADPLDLLGIGDAIAALLAGTSHEQVELEARGAGAGRIRAFAEGGAELELPFEVVAAEAVTRVSISVTEPGSIEDDLPATLAARAFVGDREVTEPPCSWSIASVEGPLTLSGSTGPTASVNAGGPGSAEVTCRIGGASASTRVRF